MGRIDISLNDPHEAYTENHIGHRKGMCPSEAWYSTVKCNNADGDVFNTTEANTMEPIVSLQGLPWH